MTAAHTVLVIEDNGALREMFRRMLTRKGFTVHLAIDGIEGVEQTTTLSPDIVLLDMSLPRLNGWEAATMLKSDPKTASIPIIAITAHAMSGHRERAIQAGCDDYVSKPIAFDLLFDKIHRLIRT